MANEAAMTPCNPTPILRSALLWGAGQPGARRGDPVRNCAFHSSDPIMPRLLGGFIWR